MDMLESAILGLMASAMTVLAMLFMPLGYAAGGYITGWVLANVFTFAGNWAVDGFNALGMDVTINALPAIGAALGFTGSFFRAQQTNKNEQR